MTTITATADSGPLERMRDEAEIIERRRARMRAALEAVIAAGNVTTGTSPLQEQEERYRRYLAGLPRVQLGSWLPQDTSGRGNLSVVKIHIREPRTEKGKAMYEKKSNKALQYESPF